MNYKDNFFSAILIKRNNYLIKIKKEKLNNLLKMVGYKNLNYIFIILRYLTK